jgi:UPF0755 protein
MRLLVLGTLLITVAFGMARVWVDRLTDLQIAVAEIEVTPGESASAVLARLAPALSLTERRLIFQLYPDVAEVKAGLYRFTETRSVIDAMRAISDGEAVTHRLTVPEGITAAQLFKMIAAEPSLQGSVSRADGRWSFLAPEFRADEGAFLAETYVWTATLEPDTLLESAHQALLEALETAWAQRTDTVDRVLSTPYELLILASIIEKETALASERPKIAGVFIERLHRGMRLQTDPTVIYGLGERFDGNLTRQHLREKTVYNTYRIDGLPPTPIALVGPDALMAAARPEMTGHLYFVADGSGGHAFAKTLEEHNANVRKYQLGQ